MATRIRHEDTGGDGQHESETRLHVEEEHELERRTKAELRAAEHESMQLRMRPPNQRYTAHRRGNR